MQTLLAGSKPTPSASPFQSSPSISSSQTGIDVETKSDGVGAAEKAHSQPRSQIGYFRAKRLFDLTVVLLTLGLIWPLLGLIALAIVLESPGAVLVEQKRIGVRRRQVDGQIDWQPFRFTVYQFRTIDAAQRLTIVGAWLRKSSLYELPQLWNILRGEISLVGPSPALPTEVASYSLWQRKRLETQQGMTGLGQLRSGGPLRMDEMIQADIEYIETQSFGLDLQILFKTFLAALHAKGIE